MVDEVVCALKLFLTFFMTNKWFLIKTIDCCDRHVCDLQVIVMRLLFISVTATIFTVVYSSKHKSRLYGCKIA